MKKTLTFVFVIVALLANAQGFEAAKKSSLQNTVTVCSPFYLGLSMGINNPHGFIGVNFEMPISQKFTFSPGIGISSWGTKVGGMLKYYTKPCCTGWAYGFGLTYNNGYDNIEQKNVEVLTPLGTTKTTIKLNLFSQTNIAFNAYKYFKINTKSRFFVHAGYSFAMTQNKFNVISGHKLTETSILQIKSIAPGGLSLGFGLQFGTKS